MASRQVKKLLQQKQEAEFLAQSAADEDEEEVFQTKAAPFNPFDLLSDEDQPEEAQVEDEPEDEQEAQVESQKPAVNASAKPAQSKKSKKKKGKSKGGALKDETADEAADGQGAAAEELEQIDKLIQEMSLQTVGAQKVASGAGAGPDGTRSTGGTAATYPALGSTQLLAVDTQCLKGDDELKRIFGASVIAAVDREEQADAATRRRNAAAMRGRPGAAAALRRGRKGLLVTPKEHWPPLDGGLSMEFTGVKDGVRCFRYSWSPVYRHLQNTFERIQSSHDPNAIAALLQSAPYHVDSLLAMYDLYRHLGENQYAEEVLHRALHALEAAWHPQFDIRTANCRVDFEEEQNRGLFFALFRHVQALSRTGCHRTALEVAKLLLALEPLDPLGVLCMMDYLTIRAGRYAYLHEFVSGWEADASLGLRPNFAYGQAFAALRLEQQQKGGSSSQAEPAGSLVTTPASQLLLHAILLHPSVVPKLITKLQEKGAGREEHWARITSRKLFTKPHDTGSATLQHLSSIYVERSALLWRAPDALDLLRECAVRAADMAEAGGIRRNRAGATSSPAEDDAGGLSAADLLCVRQEAFPDSDTNEFRHLRLAEYSDNVNALPREELGGAVAAPPDAHAVAAAARQRGGGGGVQGLGAEQMDIDPAVLEELQEQIALAQQQAARAGAGGAVPNVSDEEIRGANPLMMLLRSLLPWVNAGTQPEYGNEDEDPQGARPPPGGAQ